MSNSPLAKDVAIRRAFEIHRALSDEMTQVRWHKGRLLTFRYPAPHGHGVRGQLVAIYNINARREWIEADLLEFAHSLTEVHSGDTSPAEFA